MCDVLVVVKFFSCVMVLVSEVRFGFFGDGVMVENGIGLCFVFLYVVAIVVLRLCICFVVGIMVLYLLV